MTKLFYLFIFSLNILAQDLSVKIKEVKYDVKSETLIWKVDLGTYNYIKEKFSKIKSATLHLDLKKGVMYDQNKKTFPFHELEKLIWGDRMDGVMRYLVESSFWFFDPDIRAKYHQIMKQAVDVPVERL